MNILITGANGFIGKSLTKALLLMGHHVYGIVTNIKDMDDIKSNNLHVFEMFFDDYKNIKDIIKCKIDVAFHFAWSGLCGLESQNVDLQIRNVIATSVFMEQMIALKTKKVIFASTMNTLELDSLIKHPTITKPRGVMIHVSCKLNAEIIARTMASKNGIEFNSGIIAMAYGENNKSKMLPNVVIYSLLNKLPINLVEGNNLYDIVYIDDIISAFISIAFCGKNNESYYIGHNDKRTFKEIITKIRDTIDPEHELNFGVYKEENNLNFSSIDRGLLTKHTGWTPKANFEESIKKTAEWIIASGIKFVN